MALAIAGDEVGFSPRNVRLPAAQARNDWRLDDVWYGLDIPAFGNQPLRLVVLGAFLRGIRARGDEAGIDLRELLLI